MMSSLGTAATRGSSGEYSREGDYFPREDFKDQEKRQQGGV